MYYEFRAFDRLCSRKQSSLACLGGDRTTKFEVSLDIQPGLYGEILLQNHNLFMYVFKHETTTYEDKTQ